MNSFLLLNMRANRTHLFFSLNYKFSSTEFDPEDCPLDYSRPCQMVCLANAISLDDKVPDSQLLLPYEANGHSGFKVTLLIKY